MRIQSHKSPAGVVRARGERPRLAPTIDASQQGYTLLAVLVSLVILGVALVNMAAVVGVGALNARRAREADVVRQAASVILQQAPPSSPGGSLYPGPAEVGWSDVVYADATTGTFTSLGVNETPPEGAAVVGRQWQLTSPAGAPRRLECTAVLLDPDTRLAKGRIPVLRHLASDVE